MINMHLSQLFRGINLTALQVNLQSRIFTLRYDDPTVLTSKYLFLRFPDNRNNPHEPTNVCMFISLYSLSDLYSHSSLLQLCGDVHFSNVAPSWWSQ